jgi:hypothetical protein
MKQICEDLKAHIAEVVRLFERLADERPWLELPEENRVDHLPELIVGLVEASLCDPFDFDAHRKKVAAAAVHGRQRFLDGCPHHLLFEEYDLLREAIWRYMRQKFGWSDRTTEAIMRVDAATTLATRGSLWGYHSVEYGEQEDVEAAIDRIAASSALLPKGKPE